MASTEAAVGRGRPAVFLDRDGVLTVPLFRHGRSFAPRTMADFAIYPDAPAAARSLRDAGFLLCVVTNQPDVGAGEADQAVVEAMHEALGREVGLDAIAVCYDTAARPTERRKPGAGMLYELAREWQIDLPTSYMVGDRASDIEAGRRAGCTAVFIDRGYTAEAAPTGQSATVVSTAEAAAWILQHAAARQAAAGRREGN